MKLDFFIAVFKNKIFWYLASRYMVLGIQFLASIFLAVKLGAYYFGIWSFILLLVNIGSSCNWGIGSAATILLVQNKEDQSLCSRYTFNSLLLVLLTFLPPVLIAGYDRIIGISVLAKYHLGNLIYAVTAIVLLQYVCNFFINVFRVKNRIVEIIIQQSLWPVCMLLAVFFAQGKNLLTLLTVSYIAALLIPVIIFISKKQVCFTGKPEKSLMKEIAKKGFFLFLYNACFLFIVLTTKLQVSYFYSVQEFGYFAFAFALAQGIMLLLDSLIFLLFPKMIDMLKGNDTQKIIAGIDLLRKNYILPLHLLFYTVLAVSPVFFYFLPQYAQSYRPFVLILFTLLMYSHCFGYNSYLLAQNKEKEFAGIVFCALVLNNILIFLLIKSGCSMELSILGTLITYVFYSIGVNCYALFCIGERNFKTYIKKNMPLTLAVFDISTLFTMIFFPEISKYFVLILLLFSIVHRSGIAELFQGVKTLIKKEQIINV